MMWLAMLAVEANMLLSISDDGALAWIVVAGLSLWWSPITKGIYMYLLTFKERSCKL
jgi:hypothetical protein